MCKGLRLCKGVCLDTVPMNRFEISTLRAYYGALITEKQNEWLRLHYDEDISLGEIAELYSVSRQAVLDGIKRGERSLVEFEEKLGLVRRDGEVAALIREAKEAFSSLDAEKGAALLDRAEKILEE